MDIILAASPYNVPTKLSDDLVSSTLSKLPRSDSHYDTEQGTQHDNNTPRLLAQKPSILEVNQELRHLFDSYLIDWRNKNPENIRQELSKHLSRTYQEDEKKYAQELFANYLEYLHQFDKIPSENNSIESMVRFFNQVVELRNNVLGKPIATAFFADEEHYDRYTLARTLINKNNNLLQHQKQQAIHRLEQSLARQSLTQ